MLGFNPLTGRRGRGNARRNTGAALDAEPLFRGATLDAEPRAGGGAGRFQSWADDPPSARRVGRQRAGGPYMALQARDFASLFAFNRASGATGFDAAGRLAELGPDAIRQGFDPATLAPAGWLLEGATTNQIRNARGEGATVGAIGAGGALPAGWGASPGNGVAISVAAAGADAETGLPFVDLRFAGTPTASANAGVWPLDPALVPAANGQAWASSLWMRLVGGSMAGVAAFGLSTEPRGAGGGFLGGGTTALAPTAAAQRVSCPHAFNNASAQSAATFLRASYTAGAAIDFTVRVMGWQLEQQPFPTSLVLPPAGAPAAASRAADALRLQGAAFASVFRAGAPEGCVVVDALLAAQAANATRVLAQLDDGTEPNRLQLRPNAAGGSLVGVPTAGGVQGGAPLAGGAVPYGTAFRAGLRWNRGAFSVCLNGGAIGAGTGAPQSFSALRIGTDGAGAGPLNGRVRRVQAFAHAPADAEFIALCAPGA